MTSAFTQAYDEAALLNQLSLGNRKAFEELYSRFAPSLLGILLRIIADPDQAQDLLQDSFIKIWHKFPQYDPEKGRLFTWMLTIVRRTAWDHLKSPKTVHHCIDDIATERLGSVNPTYQTIGLLYWVDKGLSPVQRQLIELAYFQGYSYSEVAKACNLPLGTVKTHIRQALQQLRTTLVEN